MTLVELQDKLGEQIELLTDKDTPYAAKKAIAEVAQTVSSLAKQMPAALSRVHKGYSVFGDGSPLRRRLVLGICGMRGYSGRIRQE